MTGGCFMIAISTLHRDMTWHYMMFQMGIYLTMESMWVQQSHFHHPLLGMVFINQCWWLGDGFWHCYIYITKIYDMTWYDLHWCRHDVLNWTNWTSYSPEFYWSKHKTHVASTVVLGMSPSASEGAQADSIRPRSHEGIQWVQIFERSSRAALAWRVLTQVTGHGESMSHQQ